LFWPSLERQTPVRTAKYAVQFVGYVAKHRPYGRKAPSVRRLPLVPSQSAPSDEAAE